jgi:hypothetical protein
VTRDDGVVAPAAIATPGGSGWVAAPRRRARLVIGACLVAAVVAMVPALVGFARSGDTFPSISASSVPAGVSERVVGDRDLYLVRDGGDVRAFLTDSPHVTAPRVWWCAPAGVFMSWPDASIFDRDGRVIMGPAPSGLVPVSVQRVSHGARFRLGHELTPAPPQPWSTARYGDVGSCIAGQ